MTAFLYPIGLFRLVLFACKPVEHIEPERTFKRPIAPIIFRVVVPIVRLRRSVQSAVPRGCEASRGRSN